jgi:hypothetical protein
MTAAIGKMGPDDLRKLAQKGKAAAKGHAGGREFTKVHKATKQELAKIAKAFEDTLKKNPEV